MTLIAATTAIICCILAMLTLFAFHQRAQARKTLSQNYYERAIGLLDSNTGLESEAMRFLLDAREFNPKAPHITRAINYLTYRQDWYLPSARISTDKTVKTAFASDNGKAVIVVTGDATVYRVHLGDRVVTEKKAIGIEPTVFSGSQLAVSRNLDRIAIIHPSLDGAAGDSDDGSRLTADWEVSIFHWETAECVTFPIQGFDPQSEVRFHRQISPAPFAWLGESLVVATASGLTFFAEASSSPEEIEIPRTENEYICGYRIEGNHLIALTNLHLSTLTRRGKFVRRIKIPEECYAVPDQLPFPARSGSMVLREKGFSISGVIDAAGSTPEGVLWGDFPRFPDMRPSEELTNWFSGNLIPADGELLVHVGSDSLFLGDLEGKPQPRGIRQLVRPTIWPAHYAVKAEEGILTASYMDSMLEFPTRLERFGKKLSAWSQTEEFIILLSEQTMPGQLLHVSENGERVLTKRENQIDLCSLHAHEKVANDSLVDLDDSNFYIDGTLKNEPIGSFLESADQNISETSGTLDRNLRITPRLGKILARLNIDTTSVFALANDAENRITVTAFANRAESNYHEDWSVFSALLTRSENSEYRLFPEIRSLSLSPDRSEVLTGHGTHVEVTSLSDFTISRSIRISQLDSHMIIPAIRARFTGDGGSFSVVSLSVIQDYDFTRRHFDTRSGLEFKLPTASTSSRFDPLPEFPPSILTNPVDIGTAEKIAALARESQSWPKTAFETEDLVLGDLRVQIP